MQFTNYQILAAVVSEWVRPAISQIAYSKVSKFPAIQQMQNYVVSSGLVGQNYTLAKDIEPLVQPVMDALLNPLLERYFSSIPDSAIPEMAHNIVDAMKAKGSYSLLDDLIVFEEADILELENLLLKNLPIDEGKESYSVIH